MDRNEKDSRATSPGVFFVGDDADPGVGLVPPPPHWSGAAVRVVGSGAVRSVQGLASNDVEDLEPGQGVYTFFLTPKGRVAADGYVFRGGDTEEGRGEQLLICTERAGRELSRHLARYVPPILARHSVLPVSPLSLVGPGAAEAAAELWGGEGYSEVPPLSRTPSPVFGYRREGGGLDGFDFLVEDAASADRAREVVGSLGGAVVSPGAAEVFRIEAGLPAFGTELGPDRLAQEAMQDQRAISMTKGCFTGQEVVARVHYRGRVRRCLRGLQPEATDQLRAAFAGGTRWMQGRRVDTGDREGAGTVTSACWSPRLGPLALAYLRAEIEPGSVVSIAAADSGRGQPGRELDDRISATVRELPFGAGL